MAKAKEDKFILRQFKDKSSFWWLDNKVYHLNEANSVVFICGGKEDSEEIKYLEEFCKRNKKKFVSREPSVFENEPKEYKAVFNFGKHINKTVEEVKCLDKRWLVWCRDNFKFSSAQKELKEQIEEIL